MESVEEALKVVRKIGFLHKAVAGGAAGDAWLTTKRAWPGVCRCGHGSREGFWKWALYIEKLIINPHHIEFQVFADKHGHTVHLGERDCSIQRRNQKVIEECPSPLISPSLRKKMGHAAIKLAQSVGYQNAGTVEFLVDNEGHYYFIEMNTRIQVEHTITEEVYGCDLVKEQILVAAGERLAPRRAHGDRASTPFNAGSTRKIRNGTSSPPRDGLRFTSARRSRGADRFARLHRLRGAALLRFHDRQADYRGRDPGFRHRPNAASLDEYYITGIKTTVPLHSAIMRNADFRNGHYDTGFLERVMNSDEFEIRPVPARLHE